MSAHRSLRLGKTVVFSIVSFVFIILSFFSYQAGIVKAKNAQQSPTLLSQEYPTFLLPWDKSENGEVKWTSGPHSWSTGGNFTTNILETRGSGLDFAKGPGETFDVLSMASGTVIRDECGFSGLGCIVAIKHDVGGSVMIYAHLQANGDRTGPANDIKQGEHVPSRYMIGISGQTGGDWPIHLHIEFRDGASSCTAGLDCGDIGWAGNPISWDGKKWLDGYHINAYFVQGQGCDPGVDCRIENYDGSAVWGSTGAPHLNFPYKDNGLSKSVLAYVHPTFDFSTCEKAGNCEINAEDGTTVFADHGTFGGGGILLSSNQAIQRPHPTPTSQPPTIDDGLELCDSTGFGQPCLTYVFSSSDTCINLANTGWDNRADSLRFKGNYVGNYDAILYDDNGCATYNARFGVDEDNLGAFKNAISSLRIEKHSTPDPGPSDGVQLCDGTQFGQPCYAFPYTSNSTCINLGSSGWDNRADSLRFQGSYVTGYDAILYDDSNCTVYNARYGQDSADLDAFKNSISSMRIEKTGSPSGPNDGIELCDGTNFGGSCQPFYYHSNDSCTNLSTYGWDKRADSLRFRSNYAGGYDIILYQDYNCQIYNARYGTDATDLDAYKNAIASIRIEKHGPPPPDLVPFSYDGQPNPISISSTAGEPVLENLYAGQPVYITWGVKNIGQNRAGGFSVDVSIDGQRIIHYPFTGIEAGYLLGFEHWQEAWYTPGWHTVRVEIDPEQAVGESNESNNVYTQHFYWNPALTCPDCGLSQSPWAMFQRDLNHTGRSLFMGPAQPALQWKFEKGNWFGSAPLIRSDGSILIGLTDGLYALTPQGQVLWHFQTSRGVLTPLISSDGTIYAGSYDGNLYAIDPDGNQKWAFSTGDWIGHSPAVAADGSIYVGSSDGYFYAVYPNGTMNWKYHVGSRINGSPAVGSDGTIYFGADTYDLIALGPAGNLKWSFHTDAFVNSAPAIGSDGTIYAASQDNKIYAIRPDGTQKWSYLTGGKFEVSSFAIGLDGTIYIGNTDHKLYAILPNGNLKWTFQTGDRIVSSPAVGADGTIYVGSRDGYLYAIDPNGAQKWRLNINGWADWGPVIGPDNTMYICDGWGTLYSIISAKPVFLPFIIR